MKRRIIEKQASRFLRGYRKGYVRWKGLHNRATIEARRDLAWERSGPTSGDSQGVTRG